MGHKDLWDVSASENKYFVLCICNSFIYYLYQQPQPVNNKADLSYSNVDNHSIHYEDNDYTVKIITQGNGVRGKGRRPSHWASSLTVRLCFKICNGIIEDH